MRSYVIFHHDKRGATYVFQAPSYLKEKEYNRTRHWFSIYCCKNAKSKIPLIFSAKNGQKNEFLKLKLIFFRNLDHFYLNTIYLHKVLSTLERVFTHLTFEWSASSVENENPVCYYYYRELNLMNCCLEQLLYEELFPC